VLDNTRTARMASLVTALLLAASRAAAGSSLPIADAHLRVPQATVNGTGLAQFFATSGESIVPATDQVDFELMTGGGNSILTFDVQLMANPGACSSGIYNGYDLHPTLMQIFPASATAGWFAVISFRFAPVRAIVNVLDDAANLVSTTTYPGADRKGTGFYVAGASGPLYSQDARNPGARPQLLFYRGTGLYTGDAWFAAEDQPLATGSDADYDDVLWIIEEWTECAGCTPTSALTPILHSSWGELKSRFR